MSLLSSKNFVYIEKCGTFTNLDSVKETLLPNKLFKKT